MTDYPDRKRLEDVVKALQHGGESVTCEAVVRQFHYETSRVPDADLLASVVIRATN